MIVERYARVAPLGIRFVDPLHGQPVADLIVSARPVTAARAPWRALNANTSGIYVLQRAPSMLGFEASRDTQPADADPWRDFPPGVPYRVRLDDPLGRFVPFSIDIPVPRRGLADDVELFSTPTRAAPEGLAVVRADLRDATTGTPAAFALMEVSCDGQLLGRGVADRRGRVAVFGAYPPPVSSLADSPSGALSPPDLTQRWVVTIDIMYAPGVVGLPAALPPRRESILAQRATPPTQLDATLLLGEELILRGAPSAHLLVTPAGPLP